jgi:hypothetical protein
LQSAFEAPPAAGKERFIKTLRYPKTTYPDFVVSQFAYIRKRVWALFAALVLLGWAAAFWSPLRMNWSAETGQIWVVAAILPFLALLTITEIYRSAFCRMAELETSCRFTLSQIIMARIGILGGGNVMVLALFLVFASHVSPYGLLQLICYLAVPYFITCSLCLWILNRLRGRESLYGCAVAACLVCATNMILSNSVELLYSDAYLRYWLVLSAAAILFIGMQIHKLRKQTEDRTWHLLLTD